MLASKAKELLLNTLGWKYVWGANGPNNVDCSGLRYWWANPTGNKRGDTTAQGVFDTTLPTTKPVFGDMAFLSSGGRITHMGILIDDHTVIEARGRAYGVVRTELSVFRARRGYTYRGTRRDTKLTFEPDPVVLPPVPKSSSTFFTAFGSQQNHRFGGLPSDSTARADRVKELMDVSVFGITEADTTLVRTILNKYPHHKATALSTGTTVLFYDPTVWTAREHRETLHGDNYHGALCQPLLRTGTGVGVDFIVNHNRPLAVSSAAGKVEDTNRALGLLRTWPAIVMGDFAMDVDTIMKEHKLHLLTEHVDTYDPAGMQHMDAAYGTTQVIADVTQTLDPGTISDHKWVRAKVTVTV